MCSHERLDISSKKIDIYEWFDSDSKGGDKIGPKSLSRIDFDTIL